MKYVYDHIIKYLVERDKWNKIPLYTPLKEQKLSEALKAMDNKNAYFYKATSVAEEELKTG